VRDDGIEPEKVKENRAGGKAMAGGEAVRRTIAGASGEWNRKAGYALLCGRAGGPALRSSEPRCFGIGKFVFRGRTGEIFTAFGMTL